MNYFVILTLLVTTTMRHVAADDGDNEDIRSHRAWELLDSLDCGFTATDRIIGGMNASLGQFPWIVRFGYTHYDYHLYDDDDDDLQWLCGAALITDRLVLTAGHCVRSEVHDLRYIRVGEYDTESNPDCQQNMCAPPVQDRKIKRSLVPPGYDTERFHNDIAIVEMDSPVEFSDYVTPICLPREEQETPKEGELAAVAGWGIVNVTTKEAPTVLQRLTLPVLKTDACKFGNKFKPTNEVLCAGGDLNKDTCVGDSGGPLMKVYDTEEGPKHFVIGVVSFGPITCGIKKPAVYSSVKHHLKWILDSIISLT